MAKHSPAAGDLAMWTVFKTFVTIAAVLVVLMLFADMLWIVCPRLVEPLLR